MASNIFRKTALDHMASPEQLDQQVKIMKPATWVIFLALILGFVTLIIWMLVGNITNSTSLSGVVFTNNNVETVVSEGAGVIQDVLVQAGDYVDVGDIIAVVPDTQKFEILKELKKQQASLQKGSKQYQQLQQQIDAASENYAAASVMKSSYSGYIQSVKARNTLVGVGDNIATIMVYDKASSYNEVVVYIPVAIANTLQPGMEAQVSPVYAPREKYGYMCGMIASISQVPATQESILKYMGTMDYVADILPDSSVVEARIKLNIDEDSANSYQWSNPNGEKLPVGIGTICNVQIITQEQHPISLIFS